MISIQTSLSKGWLHAEGGFRFDERYYVDPLHRWEQDRAIDRFLAGRFPDHPLHLEPGYSVENCLAIHEELPLRSVR